MLPLLSALNADTGLPHKILLDEAHHYPRRPRVLPALIDLELAGYILVTYRVSGLPQSIREARRRGRDRDP